MAAGTIDDRGGVDQDIITHSRTEVVSRIDGQGLSADGERGRSGDVEALDRAVVGGSLERYRAGSLYHGLAEGCDEVGIGKHTSRIVRRIGGGDDRCGSRRREGCESVVVGRRGIDRPGVIGGARCWDDLVTRVASGRTRIAVMEGAGERTGDRGYPVGRVNASHEALIDRDDQATGNAGGGRSSRDSTRGAHQAQHAGA